MGVYDNILIKLNDNADLKYREFNSKIVGGNRGLIGVGMPLLKSIAKSLSDEEKIDYINNCKFEYFEDTFLYGAVIACFTFDKFLCYLPIYLDKVDSWAQIDSFVPLICSAKKNPDEFFGYIESHIFSDEGFSLRFCIISLLDYFLENKFDFILKSLDKIDGKGYYNDMAVAWLLSVAFVKCRDKTLLFLQDDKLSKFTHNAAIKKICESYRVSVQDKKLVKNLVRK